MRLTLLALCVLAHGGLITSALSAEPECTRFYVPGDGEAVRSIAISADGRLIAAVDLNRQLPVWDARTGAPVAMLKDPQTWFTRVAFQPDGRRLVAGLNDGRILLWDTQTWTPAGGWEPHAGAVMCLTVSPDGVLAASGGDDHAVLIHDVTTGKQLVRLEGHSRAVRAATFTPDSKKLVTAGDDYVRVWDVHSASVLRTLEVDGKATGATSLAVHPNGRIVAAGHPDDARVTLWDLRTGNVVLQIDGHEAEVSGLHFIEAGQLTTASTDGSVRTWEVPSGKQLDVARAHLGAATVLAAAVEPRRVVTGGLRGEIVVWKDRLPIGFIRTHSFSLRGLSFTPDGAALSANIDGDSTDIWRSWPLDGGATLDEPLPDSKELRFVEFQATAGDGSRRAFAQDEWIALFARGDGGWNTPRWLNAINDVSGLGFTRDGRTLAVLADQRLQLWDAERSVERMSIPLRVPAGRLFAMSPDGAKAVAGSDDGIEMLDVQSGQSLWKRDEMLNVHGFTTRINAYDLSFVGSDRLAIVNDGGIYLLDASTGRNLDVLWDKQQRGWRSIAASSDGAYLIANVAIPEQNRDDYRIQIWPISEEGKLDRTERFVGCYEDFVGVLVFHPDGRQFAAADQGHVIRMWSVDSASASIPSKANPAAEPAPPEVLDAIKMLQSPDLSLDGRLRVVRQLGDRGPRAAEAIPLLMQILPRLPPEARYEIVDSLGKIGKPAVPALASLVDDAVVGNIAIYWLDKMGTEAAAASEKLLATIQAEYRNPLPNASIARLEGAIRAVRSVKVPPQQSMPLFAKILSKPQLARNDYHQPWRHVALEVIELLKQYGSEAEQAVPALTALVRQDLIRHQCTNVGDQAIIALGAIGPNAADALPMLRAVLADPSMRNHHASAEAAIRLIRLGNQ